MSTLVSGNITSNRVLLDGVLNIVTVGGTPRIILVNTDEYSAVKWVKDAVYVLCKDKNDIYTLEEVYCNGVLVATNREMEILLGVMPSILF